jgi:putative hydrolase of the HAD superfamily
MELIRGVVFDLDDTLYFEREYVLSGFRFIAEAVGGDCGGPEPVLDLLTSDFKSGVRGNAFNRLLDKLPSLGTRWNVPDLVELYRGHRPVIELSSSTRDLLTALSANNIQLALITDGSPAGQFRKIDALEARRLFEPIVVTDFWGLEFRKPHPRAFEAVMKSWGITPGRLVYVGDNPEKDFLSPRAIGWKTARLRMNEQLRHELEPFSQEYAPDCEFRNFNDLNGWLCAACGIEPAWIEERLK